MRVVGKTSSRHRWRFRKTTTKTSPRWIWRKTRSTEENSYSRPRKVVKTLLIDCLSVFLTDFLSRWFSPCSLALCLTVCLSFSRQTRSSLGGFCEALSNSTLHQFVNVFGQYSDELKVCYEGLPICKWHPNKSVFSIENNWSTGLIRISHLPKILNMHDRGVLTGSFHYSRLISSIERMRRGIYKCNAVVTTSPI